MIKRPLEGVRVIGLEQYMAGPYCTMLLADAGAEVIKIERPKQGDPRRSMPPFIEKEGIRKAAGFLGYNRNKKSLALDVSTIEGQEIFKDLAKTADVVVENLRPGSMKKLGLSYEDLKADNPRLIWATISGFGQLDGYLGPYAKRPTFDIVAEAMSGIMSLVGFKDKPPSWTIYGMADVYSGLTTAYGVMQALFMRSQTGEGQFVDSAMFDNMLSLNEAMITSYAAAGQIGERGILKNVFPRGAFKTKNGYIALNVPDNRIWTRLCEVMERPELADTPDTKTGTERAANADTLQPIIEGWLANFDRDEVVNMLNTAGVPTGPVYNAEEVFNDTHVKARGMLMPIKDKDVGDTVFARTPIHLSKAPELPKNSAPNLGEDTEYVLSELLGYSSDKTQALLSKGVVDKD